MSDPVACSFSTPRASAGGPYTWYAVLVLSLTAAFNLIDRQLIAILAEDIKADLSLTDAQLGFLYGTAFAVFYALFGVPFARLAELWSRGRLLAAGLAVWSLLTTVSGLATSYTQLALARIGVGIGEASASPAAFSLIGDYFPAQRRGLALSVYTAGFTLGAGLSLPLGGWVSHSWNRVFASTPPPLGLNGWQAAYLVVGAPGLLLAFWVATLREPARGSTANTPAVDRDAWAIFWRELRGPGVDSLRWQASTAAARAMDWVRSRTIIMTVNCSPLRKRAGAFGRAD